MIRTLLLTCFLLAFATPALYSQALEPGFSKSEYINLMKVSAQFGDSAYATQIPPPEGYKMVYRSAVIGLKNMWDLYLTDKNIPVISIRGTTQDEVSWLANFYAAMVPAKGSLQLSTTQSFEYELASNPQAAVHVGWLVSTGFLVQDMLPKIDSLYKAGHKEMYVIGHSQGGGIAYLLTAYLLNQQKKSKVPADIRFKTYCSAGPKPGNLYFAHEYEAATQAGWAFNVVDSADWVPETPVSIQTARDSNPINPFVNAKGLIRKQSFFKRIALNYAYGKLTKNNNRAAKNYQRFLGGYVVKLIKKQLPGFVEPAYANTNDYVRTGHIITLLADESYYNLFKQEKEKVFVNHFHQPYLYLAEKLDFGHAMKEANMSLTGTWELNYVSGTKIAFDGLFPNKKPTLVFNEPGKISGNTGCNSFNGTIVIDQNSFRFPEIMAMTRMMCQGEGENTFLSSIKKVNRYSLNAETLTLLTGDVAVMRFTRK